MKTKCIKLLLFLAIILFSSCEIGSIGNDNIPYNIEENSNNSTISSSLTVTSQTTLVSDDENHKEPDVVKEYLYKYLVDNYCIDTDIYRDSIDEKGRFRIYFQSIDLIDLNFDGIPEVLIGSVGNNGIFDYECVNVFTGEKIFNKNKDEIMHLGNFIKAFTDDLNNKYYLFDITQYAINEDYTLIKPKGFDFKKVYLNSKTGFIEEECYYNIEVADENVVVRDLGAEFSINPVFKNDAEYSDERYFPPYSSYFSPSEIITFDDISDFVDEYFIAEDEDIFCNQIKENLYAFLLKEYRIDKTEFTDTPDPKGEYRRFISSLGLLDLNFDGIPEVFITQHLGGRRSFYSVYDLFSGKELSNEILSGNIINAYIDSNGDKYYLVDVKQFDLTEEWEILAPDKFSFIKFYLNPETGKIHQTKYEDVVLSSNEYVLTKDYFEVLTNPINGTDTIYASDEFRKPLFCAIDNNEPVSYEFISEFVDAFLNQ